jgi:mycothiol synthase
MSQDSTVVPSARTYRGEEDIAAITGLYNAAALVDGPEWGRSEEDIGFDLAGPKVLPEENAFLFWVEDQLVAYGRLWLEEGSEESIFFLRGLVHPDWRRRGIGTRLMDRLEQRARERLPEATQQQVVIQVGTRLELEDRQILYRQRGYELVRYFFDMECSLRQDGVPLTLPEPEYPEGIRVQSKAERSDLRAMWQATDEAFRDHWSATDTTLEQWEHWASFPDHRPELWLTAWDVARDEVAGVCMNGIEPEHNERVGRQEGWVYVLAVRRPYRQQGLGRALLLAGMRALQEAGMDWAMLGVDTENLTGALRLYEGVGFHPTKKYAAFRRALRA